MKPVALHQPRSLDEAVRLLSHLGAAGRPLAGGTDLLLGPDVQGERPLHWVSLTAIPELDFIAEDSAGLRIGAATSLSQIEASTLVQRRCAMLVDAVRQIGSRQTRNLASLGGNICNALPSADGAPPLLAADADAVLVSSAGRRQLALSEFFLGPRRTALQTGELLEQLIIPPAGSHAGGAYLRTAVRKALDLAMVGVAAWMRLNATGDAVLDARIALGAVAPVPMRATQAEALLINRTPGGAIFEEVGRAAAQASCPISDHRASASYRTELVAVLTSRCLDKALDRAKGRG